MNLQLELGLPDEEVTLAGFLLSRIEKIPRPQEKIYFRNIEFMVEKATPKRLLSIVVKIGRSKE